MASTLAAPAALRSTALERVQSVDVLRGFVMVVMALDHVRDFFSSYQGNPTAAANTFAWMFFTRWITHLCAPTFVFLCGTSIYLQSRRKSRPQLARLLLTRGLWLIALELLVMPLVIAFNWSTHFMFLQVLWVTGVSMVLMAGLIFAPLWLIVGFGAVLVLGHNALDGIDPSHMTLVAAAVWHLLHVPGFLRPLSTGYFWLALYPMLPWPGVMALGYGFGRLLQAPAPERARTILRIAACSLLTFGILRGINLYGDPFPWTHQATVGRTVMSFLDVTKYPPSLSFLLATMGVSLALMYVFERWQVAHRASGLREVLQVYGKVPFFYYLMHFTLAHLFTLLTAAALGQNWRWYATLPPNGGFFAGHPPGYGFGLPFVYLIWMLVVALCYLPCKWYAGVKEHHRHPLLSYL